MMRRKLYLWLLSGILFLGGCGLVTNHTEPLPISEEVRLEVMEDVPSVSEAVNVFGWTLLKELPLEENVFFSPLSLHLTLAMLANGTLEEGQDELLNALNIEDLKEYNSAVFQLLDPLDTNDSWLRLAFSVWLDDDLRLAENIQQDFLDPLYFYYHADAYQIDLAKSSGIKAVNAWVKEKTNGMIDGILSEPDERMRMVLANTVYFKGNWQNSFKAEATRRETFHGLKEDQTVEMMHRNSVYLRYIEKNGLKGVILPYKEDGMRMAVILPSDSADEIGDCLEEMSWDTMAEFLTELSMEDTVSVNLALPKFSLNTEVENLDQILQDLGVHAIFEDSSKDTLSKIGADLSVSEVLHKAALRVDEKGTEAAAVSAVAANETSAMIEDDPVLFVVDRPFFIAILNEEGTIYFIGVLSDLPE